MQHFKTYTPLTAAPCRCSDNYIEITPCAALRPYIRCFWGSRGTYVQEKTDTAASNVPDVIVPDTCMDIIFDINHSDNVMQSSFCGLNDMWSLKEKKYDKKLHLSRFAIRFYAWSAVLFSEESMRDSKNACVEAETYFSKLTALLKEKLYEVTAVEERVRLAEEVLLKHLQLRQENRLFMEAVAEILRTSGSIQTMELAREVHVSGRQLEQVFREHVGVSPKRLSTLVRYQCLWKDILWKPDWQIQDAVYRLKYTDEAHLMHEFKRYHGMTIPEARRWAAKH